MATQAATLGKTGKFGDLWRRLWFLLGALVVAGGLSRIVSLLAVGAPSAGHVFGFAMELGAVPLLMLWQWRLEKRFRA